MKRMYEAFCALIEAKADLLTARAENIRNPSEEPEPEPQMSGSYSDIQVSDKYEPSELRSGHNRIGFGRS